MEKFKIKRINLQLFAEGDEVEPTKDENANVEEENAEEVTTEFSDDNPQGEENEEALKNAQVEKEKEAKRQAYIRRQQEREKRIALEKAEKEKREAYVDGLKKSVGNTNPFTGQPIVDEEDVKEFELMLEIKNAGKDPIEDYATYVKEKARLERKQAEAKQTEQRSFEERTEKNFNEFVDAYGLDKVKEVLNDKKFIAFGKEFIDAGVSPKVVYEKYLEINKNVETKAEKLALQKDARRQSSSGDVTGREGATFSWGSLSDEEFKKQYDKLRH